MTTCGVALVRIASDVLMDCVVVQVLPVHVPADDYKRHLQPLRNRKGLDVLVVDAFDFPGSVYSGLEDIIGPDNPILVVANKADLLLNMQTDKVCRCTPFWFFPLLNCFVFVFGLLL